MAALSCNLLARRGYEVHFVYSIRDDTPVDIRQRFEPDVVFHVVSMGLLSFPRSVFRLATLTKSIDPDFVHLHSSFAGFLGRLVGLFFRKPRFFYSPHCIAFMRKDIGAFKRWVFVALERIAGLRKSTYLACSVSEADAIRAALPGAVVTVLENAVDLNEFANAKLREVEDRDRLRVVSVGGIRRQKGFAEFAEIAARLRDFPCDFVWIGDGGAEFKSELIAAGVHVMGWLAKREVVEHLVSSDLYLSTALWEGMPVSLIEAMAANVPIVARDCAGNTDVIENGKTGVLFSNTDQAVEAVRRRLFEPEVFVSFAAEASKAVVERFSVRRFEDALLSIYEI